MEKKFCKYCDDAVDISNFDLNWKGNPKRYCRTHNHLRRGPRIDGKRQKIDYNGYSGRNRNLRKLGFTTYQDYLKSELWDNIRKRVFAEKGCKCHLCNRYATEIHHNGYGIRVLEGKDIRALVPICRKCHSEIEFNNNKKNTVSEARDEFHKRKNERKRKRRYYY